MNSSRAFPALGLVLVVVAACSGTTIERDSIADAGDAGDDAQNAGGTTGAVGNTGGSVSTSGNGPSTGGSVSTSGNGPSAGGSVAVGGSGPSTGGSVSSGGAVSTSGGTTDPGLCEGPPPAGGGASSSSVYEEVECYLTEPALGGGQCLPPGDPALGRLLVDLPYGGYGFIADRAMEFTASYPLPRTCETLLSDCCDQLEQEWERDHCYDLMDTPPEGEQFGEDCSEHRAEVERFGYCPAAAGGEGGAGAGGEPSGAAGETGTGASGAPAAGGENDGSAGEWNSGDRPAAPTRSLCCYVACGHMLYT